MRALLVSNYFFVTHVVLQAIFDFHKQVASVVAHVSDQFKELIATGCIPSEDFSWEQARVQLLGSLNDTGRYFAFKEQMKVVRTKVVLLLPLTHR